MVTVLPWQSIKEKSTRMYCFWVRCIVQLTLEQIAKSPRDCSSTTKQSVELIFLTKWLADTVQEQQHVGGLSMFSITYWIFGDQCMDHLQGCNRGKKRAGMPFSVSLLRNYGRYTKRNVNLWFHNTMKKSSRKTKKKQAKGISVK